MRKTAITLAFAAASAMLTAQEVQEPQEIHEVQEAQEAQEMQEKSAAEEYASQWFDSPEAVSAWTNAHPVRVALIGKYGTPSLSSCTFTEIANAVVEYAANPEPFDLGDDLDSLKKDVLRSALKIMKRALRQKGISFVVAPDGSNPMQTAVNGLSAALNSGKMSGVKEWIDEWAPGSDWTPPVWDSDESVNSTMESVFFGDVDFSRRVQFRLCAVLGVTEYNKFVDRYNGAEELQPTSPEESGAGESEDTPAEDPVPGNPVIDEE